LDSDIDDDIEDADIAYEVAYSSTSAAEPLSYSIMALGNWSLDPKGRRSLAPSGYSRSTGMQTAL